jgi:integrase
LNNRFIIYNNQIKNERGKFLMASILKRGSAYLITVSLGVKKDGFTQNRKTTTFNPPYGLTEKQGLRAAQDYAREFEKKCRGLSSYNENMTLSELCEWYYQSIAPNRLREQTAEIQKYKIDSYILSELGNRKLRELKPAMFMSYFSKLVKTGSKRILYRVRNNFDLQNAIKSCCMSKSRMEEQGIASKATINRIANGSFANYETCQKISDCLGVPFDSAFEISPKSLSLSTNSVKSIQMILSAVFTAAVKAEIISKSPLTNIDLPQAKEINRPVLNQDQARLFISRLADVSNLSARAMIITSLFTGARSGELRALKWEDINLDLSMISIDKSIDRKNRVTLPKTKSSVRLIKIDCSLTNFLTHYKQQQDEQKSKSGLKWKNLNIVFPSKTGDYIGASCANQTLKKVIKGTDIPQNLHMHSLRHSFASILIDSGVNVKTVQDVLGHSSPMHTLSIYSHSFANARAKAMEAVSLAITEGNDII